MNRITPLYGPYNAVIRITALCVKRAFYGTPLTRTNPDSFHIRTSVLCKQMPQYTNLSIRSLRSGAVLSPLSAIRKMWRRWPTKNRVDGAIGAHWQTWGSVVQRDAITGVGENRSRGRGQRTPNKGKGKTLRLTACIINDIDCFCLGGANIAWVLVKSIVA